MTTTTNTPAEAKLTGDRVLEVPSSQPGNDPYLVRVEVTAKAMSCQCKGFAYRGNCRHLVEALAGMLSLELAQVLVEEAP